jgi:hypothetical protein
MANLDIQHYMEPVLKSRLSLLATMTYEMLDYLVEVFSPMGRSCRIFCYDAKINWLVANNQLLGEVGFTLRDGVECSIPFFEHGVTHSFRMKKFIKALSLLPRISDHVSFYSDDDELLLIEEDAEEIHWACVPQHDFVDRGWLHRSLVEHSEAVDSCSLTTRMSLALIKQIQKSKIVQAAVE